MMSTVAQQAVIRQLPPPGGLRIIEYRGDGMMGAHILPKSKLVIDPAREPQNGDVVVVERGKQFTVRFFKCNDHKCWLISANRNYADMVFEETAGMKISVVVSVLTDTTLLRPYMV